jgi:hypothetical protein
MWVTCAFTVRMPLLIGTGLVKRTFMSSVPNTSPGPNDE